MDTSELMQYSQFTTAPMPSKQNGINVEAGVGSGAGRESSKWGNFDDPRGVEDSREIDSNITGNRNRDRDSVPVETKAMDGDESAELISRFDGMYTTKSKRVDSGGPVVTRPLKILQENCRAEEPSPRGNSAGDRKVANGIRVPLREVKTYI